MKWRAFLFDSGDAMTKLSDPIRKRFDKRERWYRMYNGRSLSGEAYSSIEVGCLIGYRFAERSEVELQFSLPLVALILRPGYSLHDPLPEEDDNLTKVLRIGEIGS